MKNRIFTTRFIMLHTLCQAQTAGMCAGFKALHSAITDIYPVTLPGLPGDLALDLP